ncbi:MAG TPA: anti-phage dCTP deaminase [Duganella sp.]|uniref:anti-phage dCTP deaminase n=1 Tax=Duganella sp. TaxID=1904440 RepID=UPI002ED014B7
MPKRATKKRTAPHVEPQLVTGPDERRVAKPIVEHPLSPDPHPELVFGIVGPIGVNLEPVITVLYRELQAVGYKAKTIQLSRQIEVFFGTDHSLETEDNRISHLMDEGTRLRTKSGSGDAVALLGIAEIRRIRSEELGGKPSQNAFILRSLKHPKEVETLRSVYGKGFFLISVYSPREGRVTALADRISRSNFGKGRKARSIAEDMVERDEEEESTSLGQDVRDAFPLADLFVDSRNKAGLALQISRFFELLFGNVFHTPSRDEQGMHYARSAALRSADLNRQVGAAILRVEGDLIAVGCNDVPKAGGDLYWPGDKGDARDFQKGVDAMADERLQVLGELLERFESNKLLSGEINATKLNELVRDLISGGKKAVLRGTRVMGLLEFGRSVHAEMAALMSAARLGISVKDATLFCTTFPCHMCARHIVASGIKRVVYVEPYPKSKAKPLHRDSISVDPAVPSIDLVNFEPFEGVAPRQYQDIFDAGELRKDSEGKAVDWRGRGGKPRFLRFQNTYLDIETAIVSSEIPRLMKALKLAMPEV